MTFAGDDESTPFHRLDGIAISRQRTYFFIIFQPPQNWVAAKRISSRICSEDRRRDSPLAQMLRSSTTLFVLLMDAMYKLHHGTKNDVLWGIAQTYFAEKW